MNHLGASVGEKKGQLLGTMKNIQLNEQDVGVGVKITTDFSNVYFSEALRAFFKCFIASSSMLIPALITGCIFCIVTGDHISLTLRRVVLLIMLPIKIQLFNGIIACSAKKFHYARLALLHTLWPSHSTVL